ncbi:DUF4407 domain-containing protein [Reyranella soli]|uniref:Uncharacterized protein n=1 Tax=Reyranella soli TaxID=1230389 RepID=A0A512NRS6_9HYPH|nr:DUF4407 domain-containing protein [Reyranella soli]GEP61656.1 hypothetical protein RSO01_88220 [Reyranella soli]
MRAFFCKIAGVDPVALEDCPATDRVWAAQLGFSLLLNFVVVFGLTYYSIGYFLGEIYARVFVAFIVAAVVTTFDRALFQFDWFTVALLHDARDLDRDRNTPLRRLAAFARPFWRLSLRLLISLAIAYTLSVFAELAVFDGAIRERMAADNFSQNAQYRQKIGDFEKGIDEKAAARRAVIIRVEGEIIALQRGFVSYIDQEEYDLLRRDAADARSRIATIEGTLADNEKRINDMNEDIYAERYGIKDKPHRTGRPGCEAPSLCYNLVVTVREMRDANDKLRKEVDALRARATELEGKASDLVKRRTASESEVVTARRKELETLRAEAAAFEAQRPALIADYEAQLKRDGVYLPLRDDPIIRLGIMDELRRDPVRGPAFTQMSYLIKAFIAFLELAPVLAKILFAPPTVYSARIRTAVALGQRRALREMNDHIDTASLSVINVVGVNESRNAGLIASSASTPPPRLDNPQPKALVPPRQGPPPEPLPRSSFGALEQAAISWLGAWVEASSDHRRAAGDYYTIRLPYGPLFVASDMAIVDYCRAHFLRQARFFELGIGFGELSLCLAVSGFSTVGFESDAGRYEAATALAAALSRQGFDTSQLSLVQGLFPNVLQVDRIDIGGETVLVSTNVTSNLMMEAIDNVIWSLRLFDHLIIDLSRFGEVRDVPSQRILIAKLQELGFRETAPVYAMGDTDIRHFSHKQSSGRSFRGTEPV